MDVRLWGPQVWATMDFIAFNYPERPSAEDKAHVKAFFQNLAPLLPCSSCRDDFAKLLKTYPVEAHLDSRDTLTHWLVEAHNRVNERLGKPRVAYDVVANKYNQLRGTCEMRSGGGQQCPPAVATTQCASSASSVRPWVVGSLTVALALLVVAFVVWWQQTQRRSLTQAGTRA